MPPDPDLAEGIEHRLELTDVTSFGAHHRLLHGSCTCRGWTMVRTDPDAIRDAWRDTHLRPLGLERAFDCDLGSDADAKVSVVAEVDELDDWRATYGNQRPRRINPRSPALALAALARRIARHG